MKICLLSYDAPHLKTAQVFLQLHNRGFSEIDFLLMPFTPRPVRVVEFSHRPEQFVGASPAALARAFGGQVFPYSEWRQHLDAYEVFLVCGSNLIEPDFSSSGKILNVHAGLIPAVRGLDSFKWAILNNQPLGNTLHRIDQDADAGEVLAQVKTPVFLADTPASLAQRHYELEISMLGRFDELIKRGTIFDLETQSPTKRMPAEVEAEMLASFEDYKRTHAMDR